MSKISLTESQLENVIKKVIVEVRGESTTINAVNFLEYVRRKLKKTYGNSKVQIDNTLNNFVRFIEKYDLKTAQEMFKDKYESPVIPASTEQDNPGLNPLFFGSKERADQIQRDFERYKATQKFNQSDKKLDNPFNESKIVEQNISYLISEFFK